MKEPPDRSPARVVQYSRSALRNHLPSGTGIMLNRTLPTATRFTAWRNRFGRCRPWYRRGGLVGWCFHRGRPSARRMMLSGRGEQRDAPRKPQASRLVPFSAGTVCAAPGTRMASSSCGCCHRHSSQMPSLPLIAGSTLGCCTCNIWNLLPGLKLRGQPVDACNRLAPLNPMHAACRRYPMLRRRIILTIGVVQHAGRAVHQDQRSFDLNRPASGRSGTGDALALEFVRRVTPPIALEPWRSFLFLAETGVTLLFFSFSMSVCKRSNALDLATGPRS